MKNIFDIPEGTDIIEIRKKINKFFSQARTEAKQDKCILCGKVQTSFCNSHSVPQFSLRYIADNGKLLHASYFLGLEFIDIEKGISNSGTFHFICNNCDGTFFQDYENEQNLKSIPSDKMLAEIAIKNFLLQLSKRNIEKKLYDEFQRQFEIYTNPEDLSEITILDIRDYNEELQFHKRLADTDLKNVYQILFWKLLPYKVPIALQSTIALDKDLVSNIINDIHNMSSEIRMQFMHLVVLPLKKESVVLAFYHKRDRLYKKLRNQINSSSEEKVLKFLNYLIFAHTENYFISKDVQTEIETNEKLSILCQENNGNPCLGFLGPDNNFGIDYQPVSMNEIPNFLSIEYAVT